MVDSLRGLAALSVALAHFCLGSPEFYAPPILKSIGGFGFHGVDVFFVISGFVLPYSLWRAGYWLTLTNFRRFVWKRVVRIDPPYLVTIVLTVLMAWLSTLAPGYHGQPFRIDLSVMVWHLGYLNAFVHERWLSPVFWTLAIECQFYLLIAVLYPLVVSARRSLRLGIPLVLLATSFFGLGDDVVTTHLPLFVCGIAAFQYLVGICTWQEMASLLLAAAGAAYFQSGAVLMLVGLGSALVLIRLPQWSNPTLSFFGTLSYSLYLLHVPFGGRVINLALRLPAGNLTSVVAILAAFVVSLGAAYILCRLVEQPAQKYAASLRFEKRV